MGSSGPQPENVFKPVTRRLKNEPEQDSEPNRLRRENARLQTEVAYLREGRVLRER